MQDIKSQNTMTHGDKNSLPGSGSEVVLAMHEPSKYCLSELLGHYLCDEVPAHDPTSYLLFNDENPRHS